MSRFIAVSLISAALLLPFGTLHAENMSDKDILSAVTGGNEKRYSEAIDYIKANQPPGLPLLLKNEYIDDDDEETRSKIIGALKEYPLYSQYDTWVMLLRITREKKNEIELINTLSTAVTVSFTVPIAEKLIVPRSEVREKAATALKKNGDDRMLPVILSLGSSKKPIERIYLLEALNFIYDIRFKKFVISMLDDENKSVRNYAIKCISINDIKDAIPNLRRTASRDDNMETRIMAVKTLAEFHDSRSGPVISALLKENDRSLRLESLSALSVLNFSRSAYDVSELLLTEKDDAVKSAAIDTLISFRKAGNLNGLKHISKNESDPKLRIKAVYAAGIVSDNRGAEEMLKEALKDGNYRVRGEACSALSSIKRKGVSSILMDQIKTDSSRYVRSAALYAVVKIDEPGNTLKLFDIYSYESDMVFREMLRRVIRATINKRIR